MINQISTLRFEQSKFHKVNNNFFAVNKPEGGFWTSSKDVDGKSDWVNHCERYIPTFLTGEIVEYVVSPEARVLESGSEEVHNYTVMINGKLKINWEKVAVNYDGFHFDWGNRNVDFWGWDVESTVWFNPSVLEII